MSKHQIDAGIDAPDEPKGSVAGQVQIVLFSKQRLLGLVLYKHALTMRYG